MNTIPETVTALNQMGEDQELTLSGADYSLLTDLYQLTMAACYVGENLDGRWASFELFCRKLPEGFGYLIAMGLAQVLDYLEKLQFTPQQIDALKRTDIFIHAPERFWTILAKARFTGNVWAMPEGTAVFANEPMLRIEAPLWQAQIVETFLLNTLNYQTLIATRAARIRDIAGSGAQLLEFGTRRAFSPQASVWAARAAIAAGLDATSNVIAALKLGRQPTGTMAHALVMAIATLEGTEDDAFAALPEGTVENLVKPENRETLADILKYHVTPGNLSTTILTKLPKLGQANNQYVQVEVVDGKPVIGGANIIASVKAGNGIVHVIDKVLLPPTE